MGILHIFVPWAFLHEYVAIQMKTKRKKWWIKKYCKPPYCALFLFFFLELLLTHNLFAQNRKRIFKTPLVARFPFKVLDGGVIIINGTIDPYPDSLTFILDTGSGGISLDSSTVAQLGIPVVPSEITLRGIGSTKKLNYAYDKTLHLPHFDIEHLDFHINDYELLTSANGVKIDGIIGFSLLRRYIVYIDHDNNLLEFYETGEIKYPKRGYLMHPQIKGIPIFEAHLEDENNRSGNFYFDTGAGLCILMSEQYETDSAILPKNRPIFLTQAEGIGKKTMQITTVKKIKIGPYKFTKVPSHVFDDEYNVTYYPKTGGLIGNDLLRRFNMILNYRDSSIHLQPNTHFSDPFDYSYTGLSLYSIAGKVVIEEVMKNSPGEKAGFLPGDVIISIDNDFSNNIQSFKNTLKISGTKLKIIVSRGNDLFVLFLPIRNILKKTR